MEKIDDIAIQLSQVPLAQVLTDPRGISMSSFGPTRDEVALKKITGSCGRSMPNSATRRPRATRHPAAQGTAER